MSTPLRKAVEDYLFRNPSRFHMPGHKGVSLPLLENATRYDLTEIPGLDSLYHANGPIAETEKAYTDIYDTAGTLISAGGSTLCIQTMLALATKPGDKVIMARGAHTATVGTMALLDLHPIWIYPSIDTSTGLAMGTASEEVHEALSQNPDASCVYVTSPTYYGVLSDIRHITQICHHYNVPLLVDNAHGAHLKFLPGSLHPIDLGADMCCDSLHKTLPVLTGGALLHVNNRRFLSGAKERMSLFGSTSPSYLILLSVDIALEYLTGQVFQDLARVSEEVRILKNLAAQRGLYLVGGATDPIRLPLGYSPTGLDQNSFSSLLLEYCLEPELLNESFCVFLASGQTDNMSYQRLKRFIEELPFCVQGETVPLLDLPPLEARLTPRQATFADIESVPVQQAAQRIAASTVTPCPPGIPIVIPGEQITSELIPALKSYGISHMNVIK